MGCYPGLTNGSIGWKPKPTHQKKKQQLPSSPSSSTSAPNLPTEKKGGPAAAFRRVALGLTLLLSLRRRRRHRGRQPGLGLEKRSLLLVDTGQGEAAGLEGADSHSVHSSFRFSFGSQAEAEEPPVAATAAATVLLLVNVEGDGGEDEQVGRKREGQPGERQQWRRLESLERSISPVAAALVRFTYAQIRAATRDFAKGRELGRGALSRVYKGRMSVVGGRNAVVAVKKVEGEDRESAKAFCRELLIASSLRNPNVVPLLGFCVHQEGLFLVYKYVSGGSLDHHLHPNEKRRKVLPWEVRYKVATGVAQAVGYLHFGTDKCVVHRDIKPSNILLSSNKTPKLCDFGLATWTHGPSLPFLCKAVKGTFGYLAPEYFQHGKLSDKTDVYAFGVVLLELITGRKAIDRNRPQGDENLVLWAKPLLQQGEGALEKLVDPRLKPGTIRWNEMSRMVRTATACLRSEESGRPSIDQVIGMLQEEEDTCTDWSIFTGPNSCLIAGGYGSSHLHGSPPERCDIMKGHLALAMLGVSDTEEDDTFSRC